MLWPRPRTWLAGVAVAAGAACAISGGLHAHQHADALVPVLVSLQRWTPFYWEQERYGMLVPLLALPVRDPLWNLLLQRLLLATASLGAVVLLARHVLQERDWRLAGLLSAGALLALAPAPWLFEWLADQPYGLSLGVALLGLALAEPASPGHGDRGRRGGGQVALGALLVLLAHWVNAGAGLLLLPLAVARALVDKAEKELLPSPGSTAPYRTGIRDRLLLDVVLLLCGLAAGQLAFPLLAGREVDASQASGLLPLAEWPRAWATLLRDAWALGAGWACALAVAAGLGVALLALEREGRPALPRLLLRSLALLAAAVAYALLAGALRWVARNGFHWRYLAPSFVLVHVAAFSLLAEPVARTRRAGVAAGRLAWAAALALPVLGALWTFGPPSPVRVRDDLDRTAGALTARVREARCDALAGAYWNVWPAVWHAGWTARDARALYGVADRAGPTVPRWARPGARVCVAPGEEAEADRWLSAYGLAGSITRVALPPPMD
ncbi:MAG: hypothetical protein QM704_23990 [Anaeromyxobacteraceae bacterium]